MTDHTQSAWLLERPDGPHGNFEVVTGCPPVDVALPVGRGLGHYYNDNQARSPSDVVWQEAERSIHERAFPGPFFGASMIFSNYTNLEIVASQADGRLAHFALVGVWGWRGPVFIPGVMAAGPPALIQGRFGRRGNFEVIVPRAEGGLAHLWRNNDSGDTWAAATAPITTGRWSGVGLIHSSFGNLELVGVMDGALVFMWQNGPAGPWSGPMTIDAGVRGRPGFIQSTYGGRHGNFEVVAARVNGGLSHYWRDNSASNLGWSRPVTFNEMDGSPAVYEDVTVIQSSYEHLEVLARHTRSTLVSHFRAAWAAPWQQPNPPWGFPC